MLLLSLLACLHHSEPPERQTLSQTCDEGDTKSCRNLAIHQYHGTWEAADPQAALLQLEQRCTLGDARACGMSLLLLRQQIFLKKMPANLKMEQALMEKTCDGGYSWACLELGQQAAPVDLERARDAWRRACEKAPNGYHCGLESGSWAWQAPPQPQLPPDFASRLKLAEAGFVLPPQFDPIEIQENPDLAYQYAIAHTSGRLELRFVVEPLAPLLDQYQACKKPDCVMVHPDKLGDAMLTATWLNLSAQPSHGPSPFPDVAVRLEFNADWGKVTGFPPRSSFAEGWPIAALVGLHRDGLGDLLVVALMKDPAVADELWPAAFHALRFQQPVGLGAPEP